MSLEQEAKLAANAAFRPPPMDGLVTGTTAVARTRLELEATYYDTAELQLAGWGVTLRHRTGEPGRAWTLKLPSTVTEQTLERQELHFAGEPALVPRAAADLVRGYVRGDGLIPVARLHRRCVHLHVLRVREWHANRDSVVRDRRPNQGGRAGR